MNTIANNAFTPPAKLSRWYDTKSNKDFFVFDTYTMPESESEWFVWLVELRNYIGEEPVRFLKVSWELWKLRTEEPKTLKLKSEEKILDVIG